MMPGKARLLLAWQWECPECRANNWHPGTRVRPEKLTYLERDALGLDEDEDAMQAPMTVTCSACFREFETSEEG